MNPPRIVILILNWNGREMLRDCLVSLADVSYSNYSILVVDNGSSDQSSAMVRQDFPQVELLCLKDNCGYARGNNAGWQHLISDPPDMVLFLNNDTRVSPDFLDKFATDVAQADQLYIRGPKIHYAEPPDRLWFAGGIITLTQGFVAHRGIREIDRGQYDTPETTAYITGCCLLIDWNHLVALNGFDEKFGMYAEDVDLCLRAQKMGIQCRYVPGALIWHRVSASLGGEFRWAKQHRKFRALVRLIRRHLPLPKQIPAIMRMAFTGLIRIVELFFIKR